MTQLLIKNEMIMLQWYMEAHNYNEIEIEDWLCNFWLDAIQDGDQEVIQLNMV
jgi:hypothetical protein